jgi:phage terminase small subunit
MSAYQLLQNPRIAAEIDRRKAEISKRNDVSIDWVVQNYKRIVMQDIRKVYEADGTMKLPHNLDDDTAFAITSMEVSSGPGGISTSKVRRADQLRALDSLARYLKMFGDDDAKNVPVTIKVVGGLPDD